MSAYILGLDLGPPGEPTAFAALERSADTVYSVRHLERFPPGTPYAEVVAAVAARTVNPPLRDAPLVVDRTAVGPAVTDLIRGAVAARVVRVTIAGGAETARDGLAGWRVSKADLVTVLQLLLQGRRLRIAPGLPDAPLLAAEMAAFRLGPVRLDDVAPAWRERRYDDLVLAVAIAAWYAEARGGGDGFARTGGPRSPFAVRWAELGRPTFRAIYRRAPR